MVTKASWLVQPAKMRAQAEYVIVAGHFVGGASSGATVTAGEGWSVAGGGSGVYTITFEEAWPTLVSFVASFGASTPANVDTYDCVWDDYSAAAGTIAITTSEAGTPTDLAASEYLSFVAIFLHTGVS